MTRSTRYFMLGSVATLLVGLCVGLTAYYTGYAPAGLLGTPEPEELMYVPKDVAVVAYANVRDVMNSALRQRLRDLAPGTREHGQEEFQRETGINIETDVDRVVACMTAEDATSKREGALVLVRGRFDEPKLEGVARDHGGSIADYRGKRIISHVSEKTDQQMGMAFLAPGLIAIGSDGLVRRAIDLGQGGESVVSNDELMKLIGEMDSGNAWAVGRFDAITAQARLPEGVLSQIPPITWFSASGHLNGGISGVVRAETRDEAAAQNLRDVVRGFMALAKMQAGAKPELQAVLQSLELSGTGNTVAISFSVPTEAFDAMTPRREPGR